MKKSILVALATLFLAASGFAQAKQPLTEEQKAERKAVALENQCNSLVTAMALSDEQAEPFRPLYTRYTIEMQQLQQEYKPHRAQRADFKTGAAAEPLTDDQIDENIRKRFALSRAIVDVREKYYVEFRRFMNPRQIQKMYNAEKERGAKMHNAQKQHKGGHPAKGGAHRPAPRQMR